MHTLFNHVFLQNFLFIGKCCKKMNNPTCWKFIKHIIPFTYENHGKFAFLSPYVSTLYSVEKHYCT